MMASSSSSSNVSDHLLQDELPWPSSSLPFAPALHSANHQWSQPLMINSEDELEAFLSSQGHHHSHQTASPLIPPQLSSLLMMQDLGLQWSNCGSADSTAMMLMNGQQDGHSKIKEEQRRESFNSRSSCSAGTAIAYHDIVDGGGAGQRPAMAAVDLDGSVLPSINISRALQKLCPAPPPPLPATQHVPYGPPPPEAAVHPHGPSIDNYKMGVPPFVNGMGGSRHWSAENNVHEKTAPSSPAPSPKKHRLESRSSTIVPSFKVRKEKLGDRIAALQQLVSPFGKTDTASVLMEAIGYIKFLQDQVETLSGPYLRSSRNKKPRTTQRGSSNANGEEETRLDLRSRGLCLVPLSCTSYVTNENGVWAPPNFSEN
ncbi:hypothetical protein EJB05_32011 [Eragrostis curvula]|uniref:BHLH domain-containing protein n=1 Tax=Eragrostis curvula TaxID=38414 RepID=A0A5J9UF10_9POAL|nr:hypothetical protein EJB05_32011 [Eragrostis curvula]